MSSCWKCGKPLLAPKTECEDDCRPSSAPYPPADAALRWLQEQMRNRVTIDWTRVRTVEDVIIVLSVIFEQVSIARDCPQAVFLARYLKPNNSTPGADTANPS